MSPARLALLTILAMIAFAGNSVLARLALEETAIDAASFTTIRLVSGAAVLWTAASLGERPAGVPGDTVSALALFAYAAGFSFAYVSLPAGTGAMLLFAAVQITMIGYGLCTGERLSALQTFGLLLAAGGFVGLMLPGMAAPSLTGALLMIGAGVAWAAYSIRGRRVVSPLGATAGNFLRAAPMAVALSLLTLRDTVLDPAGAGYAVLSGALASGLGYAVWYTILPFMKTSRAATVQLSVPVIAASGGVSVLGEDVTGRLLLASAAIIGGIILVLVNKRHPTGKTVFPALLGSVRTIGRRRD